MSNEVQVSQPITLDQLNFFWMPSGVPCFIADNDNICDIVEDMGFNIYYLISNKRITKTTTPSTSTPTKDAKGNTVYNYNKTPVTTVTYETSMFKIVNNFVGRVVEACNDQLPETFLALEETCEYTMPPIPHTLVEKMDQFFRLVYSQHGTESIVLLTYDMTKTGPEGWGVLVPEQSNTAAHCKYDADSIAEIKPENALIVGSVHSHPEMSAYASGTDHADQADFDGLHITYGWQKSQNNGATQYHMELQMSGTAYTLKPSDVFEDYVVFKEPDPEVVDWSSKVKKALPPIAGGIHTAGHTPAMPPAPYQPATQASLASGTTPTAVGVSDQSFGFQTSFWRQMIDGLPTNALVIAEVEIRNSNYSVCPCCDYDLDLPDYNSNSCMVCDTPIVLDSDTIFQIEDKFVDYCQKRGINISSVEPYLYGFNPSHEQYLMKLNLNLNLNDPHNQTDYIYEKDNDYVHLPAEDLLDDLYDFDGTKTICCNIPMEKFVTDCMCSPSVLYEDLVRFEEAIRDTDLYQANTVCDECMHYYNASCPQYRSTLVEFVNAGVFDSQAYKESISACENYDSIYVRMATQDDSIA